MKIKSTVFFILISVSIPSYNFPSDVNQKSGISNTNMTLLLENNMIPAGYPRSLDTLYGGFLSDFNSKWQAEGTQNKFSVTQARHVWTLSKLSNRYPDISKYKAAASHGVKFMLEAMWDNEYGGFYMIDSIQGGGYEKGLDKEPIFVNKPKAHIWKGPYHTRRSVMLCLDRMEA